MANQRSRKVESKSCRSCIRPEGWLARGCVAVDSVHIGVGKWLKRRRASECGRSLFDGRARARGDSECGRKRANVRGRGSTMECGRGDSECGRSLSDKMRAKSVRCASRDSRTIQRIGRDAGNCVAQTERGAFRSSPLGDKLPRSVFRLRRASRPPLLLLRLNCG